ncbi:Transcriptional regulator, LysR family [hydrothermal vent metagenome]|uniref:Transcriptional regulator, LysR family n=1 Tax=hydrothermal vent metagenome TaxID=652676 RepID=A0A3B0R5H8_9ZZZZ
MNQRRLIPSTSMLMAFEAAARCGSFTAAAQELNLTQGAISRQVSALETQLGLTLFHRIKKAIHLTEAGKIYAQEIGDALKKIRHASLNAMGEQQGGILNLAILPTFGMRWLMPRFPDFLKHNPQITVNFTSKLSPFDFNEQPLHAAIHFGRPDWPETDAVFLMAEETIPVAAPTLIQRPVEKPEELASLPLLNLETRPHAWTRWFEQNDVVPSKGGGMIFEQFALVTQAAIAGLGAALLPRFLIEGELMRGELVTLFDLPVKSDEGYYLITPKHRTAYAPANALKEWLLEQVEKL